MIKNFFTQLLSIDESRKSCVVLVLLSVASVSVFKLYVTGDIPTNAMTTIITLSTLIFGVNALSVLPNIISSVKTPTNTTQNMTTDSDSQV